MTFESALTRKRSQTLLCAEWQQLGANEQADALMYAYTAGMHAARYGSAIGLRLRPEKTLYLSFVVSQLYVTSVISAKVYDPWVERCNPAVLCSDPRIDAFLNAIGQEPKPAAPFLKSGKMYCSKCKKKTFPKLLEMGYTVTHRINRVDVAEKRIVGNSSEGSPDDISEDGEGFLLECQHCFANHLLPSGYDVTWEESE